MSSLLASSTTSTSKPSRRSAARQRPGVVDRLGQRRIGVGIMAVADHQRDRGGLAGDVAVLLGGDGLGRIQRPHVQRRMGADRQRHHADQHRGHGHRVGGRCEASRLSSRFVPGRRHGRASWSRQGRRWFEGLPVVCRPIAINLRHCNKQSLNPQGPARQPAFAECRPAADAYGFLNDYKHSAPQSGLYHGASKPGSAVTSVTFVFRLLFV